LTKEKEEKEHASQNMSQRNPERAGELNVFSAHTALETNGQKQAINHPPVKKKELKLMLKKERSKKKESSSEELNHSSTNPQTCGNLFMRLVSTPDQPRPKLQMNQRTAEGPQHTQKRQKQERGKKQKAKQQLTFAKNQQEAFVNATGWRSHRQDHHP